MTRSREAGERRPAYALGVLELEFTIEPFVEGHPGPHVLAAVAAVEALGASVDFGPFGSTCRADAVTMPGVVAAIVAEAFGQRRHPRLAAPHRRARLTCRLLTRSSSR